MEIDITGRHFQLNDSLKEYAKQKVEKLSKYSLKLETAHIVMEVQKFRHMAEITVRGKEIRFTAKEESLDMHSAFDLAYGNIQLQLARRHDKLKDHKARRYPKVARQKE